MAYRAREARMFEPDGFGCYDLERAPQSDETGENDCLCLLIPTLF